MSALAEAVEENILARDLLRPGERLVIGVSGGVDSVVLLHVLHGLAKRHGWKLSVAHLNHRLRGRSSEADESLVRRLAKRLKLPLVVESADVRALAKARKVSIEMAARELRHALFVRAAKRVGARTVAVAHHADDQVELFFLRLFRGSGGEGLGGMKWRTGSPASREISVVRPMLDQAKSVLREYAAVEKLAWREDATNRSLDIQRNRIRHELVPLLRRRYQPALARTVMRVMELLSAEAELALGSARDWLDNPSRQKLRNARARRKRTAFDDLPLAVQRRAVQLQLQSLGLEHEFWLVEELRQNPGKLISVGQGGRKQAGPGRVVSRDGDGLLRIGQTGSETGWGKSAPLAVDLKGQGSTRFSGLQLMWRLKERPGRPGGRKQRKECFDAEAVGRKVIVRHWQPGDRFQPIGMGRAIKLQDFFTNEKVPRNVRHQLVVATTGTGDIFWVENMRISERFKLSNKTIRCLEWRWERV